MAQKMNYDLSKLEENLKSLESDIEQLKSTIENVDDEMKCICNIGGFNSFEEQEVYAEFFRKKEYFNILIDFLIEIKKLIINQLSLFEVDPPITYPDFK